MPTVSAAVGFTVEVEGQAFDQTTQGSVVEIVVDGDLKQPDTFAITLRENPDPSQGIADQAHLRIGCKVKISGSSQTDQSPVALISGEVTSLEAVYQQGQAPRLIARGYDLSHRLARGQKTKTFANMKFSDIAQQVATAAGLQPGTIDDSGAVYDQCGQVAENDWDFVRGLARSIGFECLVDDDKLHFRKPVQASSGPGTSDLNSTDPLQLVWGQELMDFRPRVTSAGQVSQVQVRGWDPEFEAGRRGDSRCIRGIGRALPGSGRSRRPVRQPDARRRRQSHPPLAGGSGQGRFRAGRGGRQYVCRGPGHGGR